jgi:hypothetical protein
MKPGPGTIILRKGRDAKWRLLEVVLESEPSAGSPPEQWPEIILVGDAFAAETLAAARSLAAVYEVHIRYAESMGKTPKFHAAPDTSALDHFFAHSGNRQRRTYFVKAQLRWSARARWSFAYVRQFGGFPGDEQFWRARLSDPMSITLNGGEDRLRFRLHNRKDLESFETATAELDTDWTGAPAGNDEDQN